MQPHFLIQLNKLESYTGTIGTKTLNSYSAAKVKRNSSKTKSWCHI